MDFISKNYVSVAEMHLKLQSFQRQIPYVYTFFYHNRETKKSMSIQRILYLKIMSV